MEEKQFKVLCIDGGGIRGLFPATYLANLEDEIKDTYGKEKGLHNYFDLICGTSTLGFNAIAIALGMHVNEISEIYYEQAEEIFGMKEVGFCRADYLFSEQNFV